MIYNATRCGGVAQLGERLNGIQEVRGSIPLVSTNSDKNFFVYRPKNIGIKNLGVFLYKIHLLLSTINFDKDNLLEYNCVAKIFNKVELAVTTIIPNS